MMRPQHFINIILLALVATAVVVALLADTLWESFLYNPWLNGAIGLVFLIGVVYSLSRVWRLRPELRWIEAFRTNAPGFSMAAPPRLLAPLASLLTDQERRGRSTLTTVSVRYLLDSVQSRLDEQRDNARYLTGLMIFLGLLGTFWGLLKTIGAVGEVIGGLSVSGDTVATFGELQEGLAAPLSGMGVAFSSSLFGLGGSLVLGFLDLQANRAQNEFSDDLEEWLSTLTRLSGGPVAIDLGDGTRGGSTYVQALLERAAESTDELARALAESEAGRKASEAAILRLGEQLDGLVRHLVEERAQLQRFAEGVARIDQALARQVKEGVVLDAASRAHLANLDASMQRLLEDLGRGRADSVEELRREIRLVTRTIALASGTPDPGA